MAKTKKWQDLIEWNTVSLNGVSLKVALVSITPDIAQLMLEGASNYRSEDICRTTKYASVMAEDAWEVNADTIKFDTGFNNTDGRHRLRACIRAGRPFTSLVVACVESVAETDRGKPRTFAQAVAFAGEKHACDLASTISFIWGFSKFMVSGARGINVVPTCSEGLTFLSDNPMVREFVRMSMAIKKMRGTSRSGIAGLLFCGCREADIPVAKAESFIDGLVGGVEGNFSDARHVLHVRLMANAASKARLAPRDVIAITIKAWNQWLQGRSANHASIRWSVTEEYPKLITSEELK